MLRPLAAAFVAAALFGAAVAPAMADAPDPVKWRALDPEDTLYIDTNKGRIVVELYPEIAPQHVARIKQLARQKFYDGVVFHRVIDGFMAQTGDPEGTGMGGSTLPDLPAEFSFSRSPAIPFVEAALQDGARLGFLKALPIASQTDLAARLRANKLPLTWGLHCPGVASMARGESPNSANSQFFLMRSAYPTLNRGYTIWGRVVWGQDVVNALTVRQPFDPSAPPGGPGSDPNPPAPDRMTAVRVVSDLAANERAPIYIMRTESAHFSDLVQKQRREQGADFSICNVPVPVRVPKEMMGDQGRERPWWRIIPFL